MTSVFISHASRDKPLVDRFVDLLETGVGVAGADVVASSIEGRGVPAGVDYRAYLRNKLEDAGVVIFLLSPQFYASPFCMAELGAAWGLGLRVFLLVVPPLDPMAVTDVFGNVQLELVSSTSSLDKLLDELNELLELSGSVARWTTRRDQFVSWLDDQSTDLAGVDQADAAGDEPAWRDRGIWNKSIVDGTLYIGNGYSTIDLKRKIGADLASGSVLPTVYAYITNHGYQNWLSLTQDPGYVYYRHALDLYNSQSGALAKIIKTAVGGSSDLDLVSLGPGDGRKDLLLLRALARLSDPARLYYYPFDINPSMVSSSMKMVGGDSELRDIKVKAIVADFDALPQFKRIYQFRTGPNVLLLLGNTLGNMPNERSLLERIHKRAMMQNDILIVEVRNRYVESDPERALGAQELNKRFDFGPLEYLGVPFDREQLDYSVVEHRSVVSNTLTVAATYARCKCRGPGSDRTLD